MIFHKNNYVLHSMKELVQFFSSLKFPLAYLLLSKLEIAFCYASM